MRKYIVLICLILNGCFYQTVSQWDIERATTKCGGSENVVAIIADFTGSEYVTCKSDNKQTNI